MDDMNDLECHELKPLDSMTNLGLWVILMILGHEEKASNVMNNLGLGMT